MRDTIDNCVLIYAIFDNLTRSKIIQLGSHAKIAGCLRALLKDGKFCLQTCFFCINGFARNSRLYIIYCQEKKFMSRM